MPQQEALRFWNNKELLELVRRQREVFRRTGKREPLQSQREDSRTKVEPKLTSRVTRASPSA